VVAGLGVAPRELRDEAEVEGGRDLPPDLAPRPVHRQGPQAQLGGARVVVPERQALVHLAVRPAHRAGGELELGPPVVFGRQLEVPGVRTRHAQLELRLADVVAGARGAGVADVRLRPSERVGVMLVEQRAHDPALHLEPLRARQPGVGEQPLGHRERAVHGRDDAVEPPQVPDQRGGGSEVAVLPRDVDRVGQVRQLAAHRALHEGPGGVVQVHRVRGPAAGPPHEPRALDRGGPGRREAPDDLEQPPAAGVVGQHEGAGRELGQPLRRPLAPDPPPTPPPRTPPRTARRRRGVCRCGASSSAHAESSAASSAPRPPSVGARRSWMEWLRSRSSIVHTPRRLAASSMARGSPSRARDSASAGPGATTTPRRPATARTSSAPSRGSRSPSGTWSQPSGGRAARVAATTTTPAACHSASSAHPSGASGIRSARTAACRRTRSVVTAWRRSSPWRPRSPRPSAAPASAPPMALPSTRTTSWPRPDRCRAASSRRRLLPTPTGPVIAAGRLAARTATSASRRPTRGVGTAATRRRPTTSPSVAPPTSRRRRATSSWGGRRPLVRVGVGGPRHDVFEPGGDVRCEVHGGLVGVQRDGARHRRGGTRRERRERHPERVDVALVGQRSTGALFGRREGPGRRPRALPGDDGVPEVREPDHPVRPDEQVVRLDVGVHQPELAVRERQRLAHRHPGLHHGPRRQGQQPRERPVGAQLHRVPRPPVPFALVVDVEQVPVPQARAQPGLRPERTLADLERDPRAVSVPEGLPDLPEPAPPQEADEHVPVEPGARAEERDHRRRSEPVR
jgi:hypothetical protein